MVVRLIHHGLRDERRRLHAFDGRNGTGTTLSGVVNVNQGTVRIGPQFTPVPAITQYVLGNGASLQSNGPNVGFNNVDVAAGASATISHLDGSAALDSVINLSNVSGQGTGESVTVELIAPASNGNIYNIQNDWGATTGALANVNFTGTNTTRSLVTGRFQ